MANYSFASLNSVSDVLAPQHDEAFVKLKGLLKPFGIQLSSHGWGAYERHVDADIHPVGKCYNQKVERKHLFLSTRIKQLAHKTICFSKLEHMQNIVIGLFINSEGFGLAT